MGSANDHPALVVLGRKGRWAVIQALRPTEHAWNLRDLAHAADVHPVVAGRAVEELLVLGAVDVVRPGRDKQVRWRAGPAADFLAALRPPDLHGEAARVFAEAYDAPRVVLRRFRLPGDDALAPLRIALLHSGDDEVALDAAGPALDAVAAAGYPEPVLVPTARSELDTDEVAQAILAGQRLG